ncbi:SAM-dependent methyltransferase [Paenibacillus caseinilyticus]|uniref:XRE family transcriptional regulator n=1 Tax=Paenibacillus mucilaginosus K02 TaxID=997761 RepID=I0BHF2_9BACL|nr:class I SAM-dependent methyltransferase [Paenibacillus mucilaginosus]AFH61799.1 XRE family transcriptional regulator [Paenibacillus mucilaginosus K02]
MDKEQLQQIYKQEAYYWGKEPNELAKRVPAFIPEERRPGKKLLDLGAGEGRDSVFLAKLGFDVLAMDFASEGLAKARRLAEEAKVSIRTLEGDLNDWMLPLSVDVIYSIGTLQYLHPENRPRQFRHWQDRTAAGGLHVLFAFTRHPDVETAPDWGKNEYLYEPQELESCYPHWDTLVSETAIFDCCSSGVAHRHAASILIARKPT